MSLTVPPLLGTVFVPFFILGCSGLVSSGALRRGFGINRGRHYEAPFLMNQTLFYYTERSPLKPARSRSDAPTRLEDIYFLWMNAWLSIMLIIHFYYLYYQIIGQNWNKSRVIVDNLRSRETTTKIRKIQSIYSKSAYPVWLLELACFNHDHLQNML